MKRWPHLLVPLAALALGIWIGRGWRTDLPASPGAKLRFYQDSMHPWVKADRPGTCPICGMKLSPIAEGQPGFGGSLVTLSTQAVTVAHVAVEPVRRREVRRTLAVSGVLEPQEARTAIVASPAGARIDYLAADHPGVEIQQGQTLARLFSPDLSQRSRFLRVAMSNQPAASTNALKTSPVREHAPPSSAPGENTVGGYRLDLFMSDIPAPISGIVTERPVTLGQYIVEGQKIATLIDPSVLWFRFDASDRYLSWIRPGQPIQLRTDAAPGQTWTGAIAFIEPVAEEARRLARVRAVITNTPAAADGPLPLRPGMLADGRLAIVQTNLLAVPKSAVISPGPAATVYVEHGSGNYEPRTVTLGREGDQTWEILSGLEENETIVTTGSLLIDAQAALERSAN